jgi:predicted lipid-binding transport protein (Tim44 family)
MKKLLMAAVVSLSALMLVVPQADAKRMGGGGSFGKQSQSYSRQAPSQSSQSTNTAKPAPAPGAAGTAAGTAAAKSSPWKGMLGGALLGLGLGALLSHFGIGGALASMISTVLMIALAAFAIMFVLRMIRGNRANTAQPSYANAYREEPMARSITPEIGSGLNSPASGASAAPADALPAGFDVESFLRNAKTYFIRLQAAWDRGDVNDIREFTTPEMFGELRLQLQERGATPNVTDVVSLDAVFYGVERVGDEYIASVKFSGMIREADHAPTEPFTEAWNLSKPVNGDGGWVLAGIQQLS